MLLRGDRDYAGESQPGRVTVPWVQTEKRARALIRMQMEYVCKLADIKAHLYPRQIPERVREKSYPTAVIQDLKKRIRMGGGGVD